MNTTTDAMTWDEAYAAYDEMINETHPAVTVAGISWEPARVLRTMDPTAYRTYFNDWADAAGIDTDELEGDPYRHH